MKNRLFAISFGGLRYELGQAGKPKDLSQRLGRSLRAAPFLSSVEERLAKAQAPAPPRRLVAMFTHYGCITKRWFPTKSHGALSADDLAPTTLKHLVPYVDKLLMPRGIRSMNEWNSTMTRGQGNDTHLQAATSFLTCQPVTPNSNDPAVANAPINKYYCNLMNALGVGAGADGFPALGGTAPVTHFGRYDRTEDFIGGTVNPPMIHDPGEFTALKA